MCVSRCIYGYVITLIIPQSCAIIRACVENDISFFKVYMLVEHIPLMFSPLNHVIYHLTLSILLMTLMESPLSHIYC